MPSCSWLHCLKSWSLHKIRCGSEPLTISGPGLPSQRIPFDDICSDDRLHTREERGRAVQERIAEFLVPDFKCNTDANDAVALAAALELATLLGDEEFAYADIAAVKAELSGKIDDRPNRSHAHIALSGYGDVLLYKTASWVKEGQEALKSHVVTNFSLNRSDGLFERASNRLSGNKARKYALTYNHAARLEVLHEGLRKDLKFPQTFFDRLSLWLDRVLGKCGISAKPCSPETEKFLALLSAKSGESPAVKDLKPTREALEDSSRIAASASMPTGLALEFKVCRDSDSHVERFNGTSSISQATSADAFINALKKKPYAMFGAMRQKGTAGEIVHATGQKFQCAILPTEPGQPDRVVVNGPDSAAKARLEAALTRLVETNTGHWPKQLAAEPTLVKPHETNHNRFRVDISEMYRLRNGKVPLRDVLDKDCKYLWIAKHNPATDLTDIIIGYEHADPAGKLHGHPTLAFNETATGAQMGEAFLGGELYFKNSTWNIDNNSGRFGQGNIKERKSAKVSKKNIFEYVRHIFSEKTDLKVSSGTVYSKNILKRQFQKWFA